MAHLVLEHVHVDLLRRRVAVPAGGAVGGAGGPRAARATAEGGGQFRARRLTGRLGSWDSGLSQSCGGWIKKSAAVGRGGRFGGRHRATPAGGVDQLG